MRIRYRLLRSADFHEYRTCLRRLFPDLKRCQLQGEAPRRFAGTIDQYRFSESDDESSISVLSSNARICAEIGTDHSIRAYLSKEPLLSITAGSNNWETKAPLGCKIAPPGQAIVTFGPGPLAILELQKRAVEEALRLFGSSTGIDVLASDSFVSESHVVSGALGFQIYSFLATLDREPEEIVDLHAFRSASHQIFVLRVAHALVVPVESEVRSAAVQNDAAISRAEEYIRSYGASRLTPLDLARHAGLSLRALQTLFHSKHGCTIGQYVKNHRLALARQMLEAAAGTHATVAEIATRSGFSHPSRFTQEYKARFGERPSHTLRRSVSRSCL